ncbi:MAG: glycosyltransferase family 4 protein [Chitinophagaceae bacterium]
MLSGTLFLTLKVFSATGGIEKVSRIAGKALNELYADVDIYSMHDKQDDANEKYFPLNHFKAFNASKVQFVTSSVAAGRKKKLVIMSHINLLAVGYLIKSFSPSTKLVLLAHGIEVWKKFRGLKKKMLQHCDLILPVSRYTMNTMSGMNKLEASRFRVLNNCLDPFLQQPRTKAKSQELLSRYGFTKQHSILMTLCRMSSEERYKCYDKVLMAMKELNMPNLRYMIIGSYDKEEKTWIDSLVRDLNLEDSVVFTGFVEDDELADHFNLTDLYVMPSTNEGFGIVFIEAMYYGKPVIAGNKDGSVDALNNGSFGTLVDPHDVKELSKAIAHNLDPGNSLNPGRDMLNDKFSYDKYRKNLESILNESV